MGELKRTYSYKEWQNGKHMHRPFHIEEKPNKYMQWPYRFMYFMYYQETKSFFYKQSKSFGQGASGMRIIKKQNLPGCWRWRDGEEKAFSVSHRQRPCSSPRLPKLCSGSGPLHGLHPFPCGCPAAGLQWRGSPWAPGCAWELGIPGSPLDRHSPPCIYYTA